MTFSPDSVASFLENHGFRREIAGDADFSAAVAAILAMREHRLGLIVSGKYGCGKTVLCKAIAELFGAPFRVRLGVASELVRFDRDWQDFHAINPFRGNVYLDDLGAELPSNLYGVRFEIVGDFIMQFHELHAPGTILIISTNHNLGELDERYGGRLTSRLKEDCVPLRLTGDDKRTWQFIKRV